MSKKPNASGQVCERVGATQGGEKGQTKFFLGKKKTSSNSPDNIQFGGQKPAVAWKGGTKGRKKSKKKQGEERNIDMRKKERGHSVIREGGQGGPTQILKCGRKWGGTQKNYQTTAEIVGGGRGEGGKHPGVEIPVMQPGPEGEKKGLNGQKGLLL